MTWFCPIVTYANLIFCCYGKTSLIHGTEQKDGNTDPYKEKLKLKLSIHVGYGNEKNNQNKHKQEQLQRQQQQRCVTRGSRYMNQQSQQHGQHW